MEKLVSIIVPIYNVEKYLEKCLETIINQTYKNIEIILVDDGSQDNSGNICNEFASKDKRIKVIHQKNKGLSGARNSGIEVAHGNYLMFIDSDDYIDTNMISVLVETLELAKADISICAYYDVKNNNIKSTKFIKKNFIVEGKKKFECLYNEYSLVTLVAWNKLYKKELFSNIKYEQGKIHEDEFIIYKLLEKANKVAYNLEPLYYYIQRGGSITNTFNIKRFDAIEAIDNRIDFFEQNSYLDLLAKERYRRISAVINLLAKMKCYSKYDKELANKYISDNIILAKKVFNNKNIIFLKRVKVVLFLILKEKMIDLMCIKYKIKDKK